MTEVMIQIDLHLQREKVPYLQEYNGSSLTGAGVIAKSDDGVGIHAESVTNSGICATSTNGYAALLDGDVRITGCLKKAEAHLK
jgi:hypothetical protein